MRPLRALLTIPAVVCLAASAQAQDTDAPRRVGFADVAYARTWDDEGLLGSGGAVSGGAGYRVSERWTLQALVSRVPYTFNREYLTIDGRYVFAGVEAAFRSRRETFRPIFTVGAGMMNDDSTWRYRRRNEPGLPDTVDVTDHHYTLSMFTMSTGMDFRVSDRTAVVARLRMYGLLDTGDDLAPHTSIQPGIGVTYRW